MADYLYGKLNKELELAEYTGKESDTANVEIDNSDHTIEVNVKGLPISMTNGTGIGSVETSPRHDKLEEGFTGKDNIHYDINNGLANANESVVLNGFSYIEDGSKLSTAVGNKNVIKGTASGSFAEGDTNLIDGASYSHIEGYKNSIESGTYSHAEGAENTITSSRSHAEGQNNEVSGNASHAEGVSNQALAQASHVEGYGTIANAEASHAEGKSCTASGIASHAEGTNAFAQGQTSHAEGSDTLASGVNAHAEGSNTKATQNNSHAQGRNTVASGYQSFSSGDGTTASGNYSFAAGLGTVASNESMTALGAYNTVHNNIEIFSIGNGTSNADRRNAFTVDRNGSVDILSRIRIGTYDASTGPYYSAITPDSIKLCSLNSDQSIIIDWNGISMLNSQGQVSKSKTWDQILG